MARRHLSTLNWFTRQNNFFSIFFYLKKKINFRDSAFQFPAICAAPGRDARATSTVDEPVLLSAAAGAPHRSAKSGTSTPKNLYVEAGKSSRSN